MHDDRILVNAALALQRLKVGSSDNPKPHVLQFAGESKVSYTDHGSILYRSDHMIIKNLFIRLANVRCANISAWW